MSDGIEISVVVVSHNSARDLAVLLPGLMDPRLEVIVVDSASTDDSVQVATTLGVRVVAERTNVGFSRGCNLGARLAAASTVVFLNADTRPTTGDLLGLAARCSPESPAWSPCLIREDGSIASDFVRFPDLLTAMLCFTRTGSAVDRRLGYPAMRRRNYDGAVPDVPDQVAAACLAIDAAAFRQCGGFDESMWLYFSDTQLSVALRASQRPARVAWDVRIPHLGEGSVGQRDSDWLHAVFSADYLAYARRRSALTGLGATIGVFLLDGVIPAARLLAMGRPAEAARLMRFTVGSLTPGGAARLHAAIG